MGIKRGVDDRPPVIVEGWLGVISAAKRGPAAYQPEVLACAVSGGANPRSTNMTLHTPEEWRPFVIMGNTTPPRDPKEDEEDGDEEEEDDEDEEDDEEVQVDQGRGSPPGL